MDHRFAQQPNTLAYGHAPLQDTYSVSVAVVDGNALPDEVLLHILSYLDEDHLTLLRSTSKRWCGLCGEVIERTYRDIADAYADQILRRGGMGYWPCVHSLLMLDSDCWDDRETSPRSAPPRYGGSRGRMNLGAVHPRQPPGCGCTQFRAERHGKWLGPLCDVIDDEAPQLRPPFSGWDCSPLTSLAYAGHTALLRWALERCVTEPGDIEGRRTESEGAKDGKGRSSSRIRSSSSSVERDPLIAREDKRHRVARKAKRLIERVAGMQREATEATRCDESLRTPPSPRMKTVSPGALFAAAAKGGRLDCMKWLRERGYRCDPSAICEAARSGHAHVVEWLIDNGEFAYKCPIYGTVVADAVGMALEGGHTELALRCYRAGVFPSYSIGGSNGTATRSVERAGSTACRWLMIAADRGDVECARRIIDSGIISVRQRHDRAELSISCMVSPNPEYSRWMADLALGREEREGVPFDAAEDAHEARRIPSATYGPAPRGISGGGGSGADDAIDREVGSERRALTRAPRQNYSGSPGRGEPHSFAPSASAKPRTLHPHVAAKRRRQLGRAAYREGWVETARAFGCLDAGEDTWKSLLVSREVVPAHVNLSPFASVGKLIHYACLLGDHRTASAALDWAKAEHLAVRDEGSEEGDAAGWIVSSRPHPAGGTGATAAVEELDSVQVTSAPYIERAEMLLATALDALDGPGPLARHARPHEEGPVYSAELTLRCAMRLALGVVDTMNALDIALAPHPSPPRLDPFALAHTIDPGRSGEWGMRYAEGMRRERAQMRPKERRRERRKEEGEGSGEGEAEGREEGKEEEGGDGREKERYTRRSRGMYEKSRVAQRRNPGARTVVDHRGIVGLATLPLSQADDTGVDMRLRHPTPVGPRVYPRDAVYPRHGPTRGGHDQTRRSPGMERYASGAASTSPIITQRLPRPISPSGVNKAREAPSPSSPRGGDIEGSTTTERVDPMAHPEPGDDDGDRGPATDPSSPRRRRRTTEIDANEGEDAFATSESIALGYAVAHFVISHLPDDAIYAAGRVCTLWRTLLADRGETVGARCLRASRYAVRGHRRTMSSHSLTLHACMLEAVDRGDVHIIRWLLSMEGADLACEAPLECKRQWLARAISLGHRTVAEALRAEAGCPFDPSAMDCVTDGFSASTLEWYVSEGGACTSAACGVTAARGDIELLARLRGGGFAGREHPLPWNEDVATGALLWGRFEAFRWLHENGCPLSRNVTRTIARLGNPDAMAWAIEHGCTLDPETYEGAAGAAACVLEGWDIHIDDIEGTIIRMLDVIYATEQSRGLSLDRRPIACALAAGMGRHRVVRWLTQHGFPLDASACARAARAGLAGTVKWLQLIGAPWDARTTAEAAEAGYGLVLNRALRDGCPWDGNLYTNVHMHRDRTRRKLVETLSGV